LAVASTSARLRARTRGSVVIDRPSTGVSGDNNYLLGVLAVKADEAPVWGTRDRDRWLRNFWKTENMLASGVYNMSTRYAAYRWTLKGLPKAAKAMRDILVASEHGRGWEYLIIPTIVDMLTQDNGAFMEIVRLDDSADSPCIQINHLDSARCFRTGNREVPIIYQDLNSKEHMMKWYQVIELTEFPNPDERARGKQVCAVSRMLRAAQIMRDIAIYQHEKVAGQFNRQLNIVSGVSKNAISDALEEQRLEASHEGLQRFILPVILTALDPRANLTKTTIDLASLPEGFDPEVAMRLYVIQMALAFGADPQDFAPLPGHNLGSSQQSKMLHEKGQGKGSALFMSLLEQEFNLQGIMPKSVKFEYEPQDTGLDKEQESVKLIRAQKLKVLVDATILTPEVAARMLVDNGDLESKYLESMGYTIDPADEITIEPIGSGF
jgi:hypothetical protein